MILLRKYSAPDIDHVNRMAGQSNVCREQTKLMKKKCLQLARIGVHVRHEIRPFFKDENDVLKRKIDSIPVSSDGHGLHFVVGDFRTPKFDVPPS